jgi:hypothetical protein
MKLRACFVVSLLLAAVCSTSAQMPTSASSPSAQVPRLIKFTGVAKDESGKPLNGVVGITFSLYQDQQSGTALWTETQNVQADATGHYTALLGSATTEGVPLALFSSAEVHWISTQVAGQNEQPRVPLLSVPYALKAADAETLGGLPAWAFMHAASNVAGKGASEATSSTTNTLPPAGVTGNGTKNFIPIWTGATTQGNSVIYETSGNIGIGTKTPKAAVDLASKDTLGIQATVPGTQAAISGIATATSGGTTGVYGQSSDPQGNGVFGLNNASSGGAGVIGVAKATSGKGIGVTGQSWSTSGIGGLFQNISGRTGAKILVAEDGSGTQRFSVDTQGNVRVITGTTTQVVGPLVPVNHARAVVDITQNQDYYVTLTWSFAFPDTEYTVSCTPFSTSNSFRNGNGPYDFLITSMSTTSVVVQIAASGSGGDITIHCIGVHD